MASLPKKKPAPAEKSKKSVMRTKQGNPVLFADQGKLKGKSPMRKAISSQGRGKAYKGAM